MMMRSFAKAVVPAIAVAAGAFMPVFADRTIDADYTLTADEVVDGALTVARGATVDLAGHSLTVSALKGCVPAGGRYRLLGYVDATGSQHVVTDYTPLASDRVETKIRYADNSGTYQFLFCTRLSNESFTCLRLNNNTDLRFDHGSRSAQKAMGIVPGSDYVIVLDGYRGTYEFKDCGTSVNHVATITRDATYYTAPGPFVLLTGGNYDNSGVFTANASYNTKGRFYYFKVYGNDGRVKCHIVPAVDTQGTDEEEDDVVGFYNLVTETFLEPVGTLTGGGERTDLGGRIVNTATELSELRVNVAEDDETENEAVDIGGNITLVKDGAGTFTASRAYQAYKGGTDVVAGVLKCGTHGRMQPFGLVEANLVRNGSFDEGGITANSGKYQYASSTTWQENPAWTCDGKNAGLSNANGTWVANGVNVGRYAVYLRTMSGGGDAWFEQTIHVANPGTYHVGFEYNACANADRRGAIVKLLLIHGGTTNQLASVTTSYYQGMVQFGKLVEIAEAGDYMLHFHQAETSSVKATNIDGVLFIRMPEEVNLIKNGSFDEGNVTANNGQWQYATSPDWPECPYWSCDPDKNAGLASACNVWVAMPDAGNSLDIGRYAAYLRTYDNISDAWIEQTVHVDNPGMYRVQFSCLANNDAARRGAPVDLLLIHGDETRKVLTGNAISGAGKTLYSAVVDVGEAGDYTLRFYQTKTAAVRAINIDDVVFARIPDVTVRSGATIDMNGKVDYGKNPLVMDGGTLVNSGERSDRGSASQLGCVVLTADSSFVFEHAYGMHVLENGAHLDAVMNLGGHNLEFTLLGDHFYFQKCAIKNGSVTVSDSSTLGYYLAFIDGVCDASGTDFTLRSAMLYSNVTNAHDYALVDADSNASTCTGIVDVSGTFKTLTPNFGNILLHDGATFDLSENRSPVSLNSAAPGKQKISFDNDALIYVKVGARSVFGGKPLISWDAIPENVTFQLTPEDAKRGALEVCNDGLYLKRGCAIFIR